MVFFIIIKDFLSIWSDTETGMMGPSWDGPMEAQPTLIRMYPVRVGLDFSIVLPATESY